jgi:glycosyltransferase involved in cell wall biosynthesis
LATEETRVAARAQEGASRSSPLRILFLAPQPFFEVRGTPLAVLAMVRALVGLGHSVDLLTYPQGAPVDVAGVVHRRSLALPVGRVRAGASLAKLVLDVPFMLEAGARMASGRYDVVHAVEEAAHLAAPLARLLGLPLVADVDSSIPDQLRYSGFARRGPLVWAATGLETAALRQAAAVITVCSSLTEGVRARAPEAAVFQVEDPPLVDAARVAAAASAVPALRAQLGLRAGPVVLYSGNFEPYQGVDRLVAAAAQVPEASFVFMGGEPADIGAMTARARAAGSAERCVFAGKRPPSELPAFLALADVVASPRSHGDNTPFKIYTYLAAGKPLVATRIPTHTQLLDDALALLVEPTPSGLAEGVRGVLAHPGEAAARAARGRDLVEREYSDARYREKVAAAYAEVARRVTAQGARRKAEHRG